jgi:hypothetical protein
MTRVNRRAAVALGAMALGVGLVLAGCSTNTAASTSSTTTTPSTALITTTTVGYVARYVSVGGHRVLLPTEEHHEPITAYSGFGQNVVITAKGFEPSKLYASSKAPVVFTNLTDLTQEVVFYHFPTVANSGPIPPGESYSLRYAAAIALVYGNRTGIDHGHLYIGGCPPSCG